MHSKGGKKKKQVLKFTLDCTHPVEDGIMDAANFVSWFFSSGFVHVLRFEICTILSPSLKMAQFNPDTILVTNLNTHKKSSHILVCVKKKKKK